MVLKLEELKRNLVKSSSCVLLVLIFALAGSSQALANSAGLVIKHGNGRIITKCIYFSESSISGADFLRRSGWQLSIKGSGNQQAVYQIDSEGNPNGWVFENGKCYYWAYYHLAGSSWQYSNVGAGSYRVHHGDVEGWVWVSRGSEAPPPVITFRQICPTSTSSSTSNKANPPASASSAGSSSTSSSPSSDSNGDVSASSDRRDEISDSSETSRQTSDASEKASSRKEKSKSKKSNGDSFWSNLTQNNTYWLKYVVFLAIVVALVSMILFYRTRKKAS